MIGLQAMEEYKALISRSGRLAQPCLWHFVGQRALEHLLGWEREGYANCTLLAAEAAKKGGGHLTAL